MSVGTETPKRRVRLRRFGESRPVHLVAELLARRLPGLGVPMDQLGAGRRRRRLTNHRRRWRVGVLRRVDGVVLVVVRPPAPRPSPKQDILMPVMVMEVPIAIEVMIEVGIIIDVVVAVEVVIAMEVVIAVEEATVRVLPELRQGS